MRRSMASLWLLVPAIALGQDIDPAKVEIKVEKVQGSVYMLIGAGGNIGVSVGDKFIETLHAELSGKRSGEFQMHNR